MFIDVDNIPCEIFICILVENIENTEPDKKTLLLW